MLLCLNLGLQKMPKATGLLKKKIITEKNCSIIESFSIKIWKSSKINPPYHRGIITAIVGSSATPEHCLSAHGGDKTWIFHILLEKLFKK